MAFLRSDSYCVCLYSLVSYWLWFSSSSSNAAITWTQPPPPYTPSDTSNIRTAYSVKLVNGSAVERLSWNYTLTGETLKEISWEKNGVRVGIKEASGSTGIVPEGNNLEHFNVSFTDPATLIIYDVTVDDEALFSCKVETNSFREWTDNIQVTIQVETKLTNVSDSQVECEGSNVTLFCEATGRPQPNITWTRVLDNGTDGEIIQHDTSPVLALNNVLRNQSGTYRCTAYNGVGRSFNQTMNVTVDYPPNIVTTSVNQTVNESDTVTLNCTADSNPPANITWTRLFDSSSVSFPLTITGKQDEGFYRCTASNGVGSPATKDEFITVENFHPFGTQVMTTLQNNATVVNDTFNVTCTAEANPPAEYMIYKDDVSLINITSHPAVHETSVTERVNQGRYKCVPFNSFGPGQEREITIAVHYKPDNVSLVSNVPENKVCLGDTVSFTCTADANPDVNSYLLRENRPMIESNSGKWVQTLSTSGHYNFSCMVNNSVGGKHSSTVTITVNVPPSTDSLANITVVEGSNLTLSCNSSGIPAPSVKWINVSSGEVENRTTWIITNISRFHDGEYKCEATNECKTSTTITDVTVHFNSTVQTPELEMWHFIVIGVGALVVLILVVIVACWFNKRRKWGKDTRVHDNEEATTDQQPLQELKRSGTEENAYDGVSHGYSESGPTSSSENAQGAASAAEVPAYAVVDKSKKKSQNRDAPVDKSQKKGKKKKQQEIAPDSQNVTYAVVDKSTKKKKKNEKPEDMYAQVDRSKKTKRPKNPGDVLYADLGDFHARGNMPPEATSPELLPPIKRPPAYEKTEYADITQFLKGDSTLPQSVDTSQAAKADQGQSHPPMDSTQAAEGATGANNVSKL